MKNGPFGPRKNLDHHHIAVPNAGIFGTHPGNMIICIFAFILSVKDQKLKLMFGGTNLLTLLLSSYIYWDTKSIGSWWCVFAVIVPYVKLLSF